MAGRKSYEQYMQDQRAGKVAVAAPRQQNDDAAGGWLFGNRQSTMERKQAQRQALQQAMNGNNNDVAAGQRRVSDPAPRKADNNIFGARGSDDVLPNIRRSPRAMSPPPQLGGGVREGTSGRRGHPGRGGGGGGDGGPMMNTAVSADIDARFRFLERQCQELRDEQRQILGWLSKSQDQLASESEARERAEQQQALLKQQLAESDEVQKVIGGHLQTLKGRLEDVAGRVSDCEVAQGRTHVELKRAKANLTDVVSQISSDVNAISFHLASGGSLGSERVHEIAKA